MSNFTPISSAAGGILIGVAASVLLALNGRAAGVSGIFAGVLRPSPGDFRWRALFVVGLLAGGELAWRVAPSAVGVADVPFATLVLAGLLVGVGTRLANGCTSGHGVCGMSRGSMRSVVATATFMATALVTVYAARHLVGAPS